MEDDHPRTVTDTWFKTMHLETIGIRTVFFEATGLLVLGVFKLRVKLTNSNGWNPLPGGEVSSPSPGVVGLLIGGDPSCLHPLG